MNSWYPIRRHSNTLPCPTERQDGGMVSCINEQNVIIRIHACHP